jgi:tetratricopeptide (TPR) repeat protein
MGLVSICKYKRAKTPYYLEQVGLNLYSLEELAWFLYHNICLADRQMFNERLCHWITDEIHYPELAKRIQNGIATGSNFQNLVLSVVGAVDLFDNRQLTEMGNRLKGLSSLQEQERLKLRADELLDNRNEWAAMEEYRHILQMHQNNRLGMEFYGAIWNNLGVCYARQFLFEQAAECFETSCEYFPNEETEQEAACARQLAGGERPKQEKRHYEWDNPQKQLLLWEQEYRMRQKQS